VPLLGAAKLTGQADRWSWGVLDVETDAVDGLDSQNLFAGRVSHNLFERSDVGLILTSGDPQGGSGRATYGVDLNLRSDEFRGDRNLNVSAWALRATSADDGGEDLAFQAGLDYPNDEVQASASLTIVEEDFDPALGFVARTGIKKYHSNLRFEPRLYSAIRQLEFGLHADLVTGSDNRTETVLAELTPLQVVFESGDELGVQLVHNREVLDEPFEIHEDVTIAQGAHSFTRWEAFARSSDKRPLAVGLEVSSGEFFDGERTDYGAAFELRPSALLSLAGEYELNDVDLPAGRFRVHVARAKANVQFGPDLQWSNFVQWDNQSELMGLNSRLWWIPEPGTELFLVLNQGWEWDTVDFSPEDTQVTLKVGTTIRL
jgi:hypothetical protein